MVWERARCSAQRHLKQGLDSLASPATVLLPTAPLKRGPAASCFAQGSNAPPAPFCALLQHRPSLNLAPHALVRGDVTQHGWETHQQQKPVSLPSCPAATTAKSYNFSPGCLLRQWGTSDLHLLKISGCHMGFHSWLHMGSVRSQGLVAERPTQAGDREARVSSATVWLSLHPMPAQCSKGLPENGGAGSVQRSRLPRRRSFKKKVALA